MAAGGTTDLADTCLLTPAEFGGFDHNAQTLRVVTVLESRYAAFDGLNLLANGGQVVVRDINQGLRAQDEAVLAAGEGHEVLVALRVAAPHTLSVAGGHAPQVEERPVAFGGGPVADAPGLKREGPPASAEGSSLIPTALEVRTNHSLSSSSL